jgi:hypothetical protein
MKLNVTVTKTSDGARDYIQIMSDDMFTVNVVLVADLIEVRDAREPKVAPAKGKARRG